MILFRLSKKFCNISAWGGSLSSQVSSIELIVSDSSKDPRFLQKSEQNFFNSPSKTSTARVKLKMIFQFQLRV